MQLCIHADILSQFDFGPDVHIGVFAIAHLHDGQEGSDVVVGFENFNSLFDAVLNLLRHFLAANYGGHGGLGREVVER